MVCSITPYQDNRTPLYIASQNGYHVIVQSLLGAGAEVNIARSDVPEVTCVQRVHVHVYCGEDRGEAQHGVWMCLCACVCLFHVCKVCANV